MAPIHLATMLGNLRALRAFLKSGADVNISPTRFEGWSPLMYSVHYCQLDALNLLLENGAEVTPLVRSRAIELQPFQNPSEKVSKRGGQIANLGKSKPVDILAALQKASPGVEFKTIKPPEYELTNSFGCNNPDAPTLQLYTFSLGVNPSQEKINDAKAEFHRKMEMNLDMKDNPCPTFQRTVGGPISYC